MYSPNTIGSITKDFSIDGDTLSAHGFKWTIISAKPFEHNGNKRISITAKKPRGRRTYMMVVYENGTISDAV